MTRGVKCISPDASVQEAARQMSECDVGALPVCEDDRLVGMITDRDLAVRGVSAACDASRTRVREQMTSGAIYCFEDQEIGDAARLMENYQIRRLVVLDHNQRLVGIVSLGDVALRTHNDALSAEALKQISEPALSSS